MTKAILLSFVSAINPLRHLAPRSFGHRLIVAVIVAVAFIACTCHADPNRVGPTGAAAPQSRH